MKLRRNAIGIVLTAIAITFISSYAKSNPLDEMEEWDLVYISDSTGWGVPEKYAANIERDNGKTVRVHKSCWRFVCPGCAI
jgi:hypothetical protein